MTVRLGAAERVSALALCLGGLAACSTPSSPQDMALSAGAMTHSGRGEHALSVGAISGGGDTEAIGLSDISNSALQQALITSLRNLNYLADESSRARYVVTADIIDLDRPSAALDPALIFVPIDLSVTVRIRYTVTPVGGGPPVFQEVVAATGTASASDAVSPQGRVRKANEAAVRQDITDFLQQLEPNLK